MIDNVNQFICTLADTEFARTARRSARTIWNAHRAATRVEAGKVFFLAIDEGQKLAKRAKPTATKTATRKSTRRSSRRAA